MSAVAVPRLPARLAKRGQGRIPSGVMIYSNRHHQTKAWPELLAWLEYLEVSNKRPRTLAAYERNIARLLLKHPDKRFDEFTDADLLSFLSASPKRSRHILKAPLNQWFKWGFRTRRLASDPASFLPDIRYRPNRNIDVFTEAECLALRSLPDPDGLLMTVLFETGIRNQEARCLTVRRVNFSSQSVLIREGAKGGKERIVPLTARAAGAFDDLITIDGLKPDDHFWCSHPGGGHRTKRDTPVVTSTFARWWKESLEEAGVEYRKPHTSRHTFATVWLGLIDDGDVQDILGHESIRTTRDIYQHRNIASIGERMRRAESESDQAIEAALRRRSLQEALADRTRLRLP